MDTNSGAEPFWASSRNEFVRKIVIFLLLGSFTDIYCVVYDFKDRSSYAFVPAERIELEYYKHKKGAPRKELPRYKPLYSSLLTSYALEIKAPVGA